MKVTYSWIIYSCLIYGTGILCDRKLKSKSPEAVSSYSVNTDNAFKCSNGQKIEWSLVCDGLNNCLDYSDETKELCAIYEFGTNMTMDCGRVNIKNQVISKEGNKTLNKLAPWTVGIYQNISELELLFFGTIIAPNLVISEAQHFLKYGLKSDQISLNDSQYKIGDLPLTQKMIEPVKNLINVKMVYLKKYGLKYADISVLVLAKKVPFGNGFAPVCIDWHEQYYVWNEDPLKIIGLEKRPNDQKVIIKVKQHIPYNPINQEICMKKFYSPKYSDFIDDDKLCIRLMEQNVEYRLPGAGISFLHSNTNFLIGVISYQVFNLYDKITNDKLFGITKIGNHIPWIRGIFNKHVTVKTCILPTVEGVIYSYEGSNKILYPGALINRHLKVVENCEVGYHKAHPIGFRFCLGKGNWLSSSDKLCFKMCPPLLPSDGLNIKCSYNGKYANCLNRSIPDTIATPSCKPTYAPINGEKETPLELHCQSNGTWNNQLYRCVPHCGILYETTRRFKRGCYTLYNEPNFYRACTMLEGDIVQSITHIMASWNAGVYRWNIITLKYDLKCGGTIISPNLVISAAHCFWKNGMSSKNISINDGLYKIAVGKNSRDITIIDNIEYTKIYNVEMVYVKERYYGTSGSYADDIAIVLLQNKISYRHGVKGGVSPICIDWNGDFNVANGIKGKIFGWGKTEKGIDSPVLLGASLPYIDHSSCRKMYIKNYKNMSDIDIYGYESYVTADKFCAGTETGQGVNVGDSGAGLCYLHSGAYYLTGIASVKDPYTNNSIATFTDVQYHIPWIRKIYDEHN